MGEGELTAAIATPKPAATTLAGYRHRPELATATPPLPRGRPLSNPPTALSPMAGNPELAADAPNQC
uniref:Uncharacterized protein n=1 Tax=Oryza barthii TaxID=65489 RepID=A0A0D3FS01_9ORYZ